MLVRVFGGLSLVAGACYDGGGGFTLAHWPRCVEASGNLSVYSGLGQNGQFVKLGLHAKSHTRGWSALGFAGNGGMKGASEIVVRIGDNGDWVAEDRFSLDYVTPSLDTKQDVRLIFATDNGVNTSWGVILPKDSCDIDDYSTENVSRTFLWALGGSHTFNQHVARGQFHANLISGIVPFAPLTNVTEVSLRMNATVASASRDLANPYICGIFDLRVLVPDQDFSSKVHVAKFAPFLNPSTSGYVHHMILYGCSGSNFTHGDTVPDCESMPRGCNAFKWVWAVGSQDIQLPDTVGMPIGQGDFFVALQMHYYNPALINVVDTSGVTLSVVDTPRAIDAALMQLNGGTSPGMRPDLPALTSTFAIPSFIVPSNCTNTWTSTLNVIGAIHHMHLVGVHQEIEVSRGGVNLGPMRWERIYDFRHQSIEESLVKQLLPGDELRVTCQYDTSKKNASTAFGESTDNEMCWSALMYYPAQQFTSSSVLPVIPLATMQICANASTIYAAQNLSLCTEIYDARPGALFGLPGSADILFVCNNLSTANPAVWDYVNSNFPWICPSCQTTHDCTRPELVAYGQQTVCPLICNSLDLSTYPDQSRPPVYADYKSYCDGPNRGTKNFNSTWQNRTCTPKGLISDSVAVSAVAAPVLTMQNACPNAAIKAVLAVCAPVDLDLVNSANNCRQQCRNATATLSEAFAAMDPVPSGDQTVKCVSDFNATWAPNSAGGSAWLQWTTLGTRLRAGIQICDEPSLSGAGQALPWTFGVVSLGLVSSQIF